MACAKLASKDRRKQDHFSRTEKLVVGSRVNVVRVRVCVGCAWMGAVGAGDKKQTQNNNEKNKNSERSRKNNSDKNEG